MFQEDNTMLNDFIPTLDLTVFQDPQVKPYRPYVPTRTYKTPKGIFLNYTDASKANTITPSTLFLRCQRAETQYQDWKLLDTPLTLIETQKAYMNSINLHRDEDHCPLCNYMDDLLFENDRWLIKIEHDHKSKTIDYDAVIHYSYQGDEISTSISEILKLLKC